jgi:phosphohistidine phosphatase SixA
MDCKWRRLPRIQYKPMNGNERKQELMRKFIQGLGHRIGGLALLAALILQCNPVSAADATLVYLVRHAEKSTTGDDPELTDEGRQRALELATLLRDAGIEAIYSTDFNRTRATALPLARQLGLEIRIYEWSRMDDLARTFIQNGGRYLVVGHSDTTPELVGLLGGDPGPPIDEAGEYDRLYVVGVSPDGKVSTQLRRYGKPYLP